MAKSAHPERETQNRIVKFFEKELGYKYLGNLEDEMNENIRWADWTAFLLNSGYTSDFIFSLMSEFKRVLSDYSQSPYHTNKEVYRILKYGLKLAEHPGEAPKTKILHELTHLKVSNHGKDFIANMDKYMPDWKDKKNLLNEQILDSYNS